MHDQVKAIERNNNEMKEIYDTFKRSLASDVKTEEFDRIVEQNRTFQRAIETHLSTMKTDLLESQ